MRWNDESVLRTTYLNADISVFEEYPAWNKLMMDTLAGEGAAFLSIYASDPEIYKGVDSAKLTASAKSASKALADYRKKTMGNEVQWCLISVPTESWAKKVFPDEKAPGAAVERLWKAIFAASRVDGSNSAENWRKHSDTLVKNAEILNAHNFKALRYHNSLGTNLVVSLPENHIWDGGIIKSKAGVPFSPNIPTEEIFTAPRHDGVDGVVYSSRPFVYHGNVIDKFALRFENGRVVKAEAERGLEHLEALLKSFKNMDRLGEVALVPYNSPISKSGVLFYNTLYDENASCHFAFGKAYPESVKGTDGKTDGELAELGLNCCDDHADFMIGTADLSVTGVKRDGSETAVFENGNFAF
jgi:aminopeptidase